MANQRMKLTIAPTNEKSPLSSPQITESVIIWSIRPFCKNSNLKLNRNIKKKQSIA